MQTTTSTATLTAQLNTLSDSLQQTNTLITRLSTLPFHPGSEPSSNPATVRLELAQDIHDSLKQLEEDLDLLSLQAEDLPSTPARLSSQLTRLQQDLRSARSAFRRAQLAAQKASQAAKTRERELLFATLRDPPPPTSTSDDLFAHRSRGKLATQQKSATPADLELSASHSVTTALRRTHALLTTELSRSRFAQETFEQSTAALAELGEHYSNLEGVLKGSRELLGTLLRSQKSDTWYLETAFYILLATLSWLFVKRILWGPLYQLPVFLWRWFVAPILSVVFGVLGSVVGLGGSKNSAAVLSSSARTSLIVQPSAERGSQPRFPEGMPRVHVPAGSGGENAKKGLEGKMSENIGKMAEESQKQGESGGSEEKVVRRGDGTILEDRGDVPANPKKKAFEADVEDAKHEERLRQQQDDGSRKRDEL